MSTHAEIEREESREDVRMGLAFFCAVCHEISPVDFCLGCHEGRCVVCAKAIKKGEVHERDGEWVNHPDCDPA